MLIELDEDACCGAGQCVLAAPNVFSQRDEDGIVSLLVDTPSASDRPAVEEAAYRCPANVIHVAD